MKSKVFVIMPFEEQFFEVYEMLKIKLGADFEFSHAGEEGNQQNILSDIIRPIYEADVALADLTGLNANVMYELGISHTFNKKTIIITQDDLAKLPFDLKQYRAKDYSTNYIKFEQLINYLKHNLDGAINGDVIYSNPVKDFIQINNIENNNWFNDNHNISLQEEGDKGFIDFLADIEENINKLTEDITVMSAEMETMTEGMDKATKEIERVNQNGGSGNAAFVKKQTKKAAGFVEKFEIQMREHNVTIQSLWDEIENNTLGLIENKFAIADGNKESLVAYLKSLLEMKKSINFSKSSIDELRVSLISNKGIERTMNKAIEFLAQDLQTYIDNSDRMVVSIDKILEKSKYVVGEIN